MLPPPAMEMRSGSGSGPDSASTLTSPTTEPSSSGSTSVSVSLGLGYHLAPLAKMNTTMTTAGYMADPQGSLLFNGAMPVEGSSSSAWTWTRRWDYRIFVSGYDDDDVGSQQRVSATSAAAY